MREIVHIDHVLVCVHSVVLNEDREKEKKHMKYLVVGAEGPGFASPELRVGGMP